MFKKNFPALAEWTNGWGWIEIGQDQESKSPVRILDEGGLIWESPNKMKSLERALQAAEKYLTKWIGENE